MLGDSILVAPVFQAKTDARDLYLPAGKWKHFFTHEVFDLAEGNYFQQMKAPIGQPLVFEKMSDVN